MKKIIAISAGFVVVAGLLFLVYSVVINADQWRPELEVVDGEVYQMPERSAYPTPEGSANIADGEQDREPREISGAVVRPRLLQKGPKPYPKKAREFARSGKVAARLIVHKDGSYEVSKILKETPPEFGFSQAFKDYLAQCGKFEPATLDGEAIDVYYNITLLWNTQGTRKDAKEKYLPENSWDKELKKGDGPMEISGDMISPLLIQKGQKPYPAKAKMLRRSGKVTARLIVRKDGSFEIVDILKEEPADFGFAGAFKDYLAQCERFKPAKLAGKPVDVYYNVSLLWNTQ